MKRKFTLLILGLAALLTTNSSVFGQCDVHIMGLDDAYCVNASVVTPEFYPPGGTLSGPGVTGDQFDPGTAGVGMLTLKYVSDSIITYNVITDLDFDTVPGFGTEVSLSDDQVSADLPLGFDFNFFGNVYSTIRISSNGFLTFTDTDNGCCEGQFLPDPDNPNDLIAFAWGDVDPGDGGIVEYFSLGQSPNKIFVMNFRDVPHYSNTAQKISTQVVLYEGSNKIRINSVQMISDGYPHTMGIENIDGTHAYTVEGRNSKSWNAINESVEFIPYFCYDSVEVEIEVFDTPSEINMSDTLLMYEDIFVNDTVMQLITFENPGCDPVNITVADVNDPTLYHIEGGMVIPAQGSLEWEVYFAPLSIGEHIDTIKLTTSLGDTMIHLHGNAVAAPVMESMPADISIAINACDGTATDTIYVENTGAADLMFSVHSLVTVWEDFEEGLADDWYVNDEFMVEVVEDPTDETNQVLKFEGGNTIDDVVVYHEFPASMPGTISFRFNPEHVWDQNTQAVYIGDADMNNMLFEFEIYNYWAPDVVSANGSEFVMPNTEWLEVSLQNIDWQNQTFDFYLNGHLMEESMSFSGIPAEVSTFAITNNVYSTAYIDDIFIGSDEEWLMAEPEMASVPAGETVKVVLSVNTANIVAGVYDLPVYISSNDPANRMDTVALSLDFSGEAEVTISDTEFDFGTLFEGVDAWDTLWANNIGCDTMFVDSMRLNTAAFFINDYDGLWLLGGESGDIPIHFIGGGPGTYRDSLRIYTSARIDTIPIVATVIVAPEMSLSHSAIDIEITECGGMVDSVITIENTSDTPLDFSVQTVVFSGELMEEDHYVWDMYYPVFQHLPTMADEVIINLTFETMTPANLEWAYVEIENDYYEELTLNNNVTHFQYSVPMSDIATYLADGELYISVEFDTWGPDFYIDVTASIALTADEWLMADVTEGTVGGNSTQDITLTANAFDYPNDTYSQAVYIYSNDPLNSMDQVNVSMVVNGPSDMQITDAIDFGTTLVNDSVYRKVVVYNNGCGPLTVSDINAPAIIRFSDTAFTVQPQSMVEILAWYRPTATTAIDGSNATVVTPDGDATIALTGIGVNTPPIFHIDSTSLTALSQCEYEHVIPVTIWNTGEADLQFDIETSDPAFVHLSDNMGVISMNDSAVVDITFDGQGLPIGEYIGSVTVNTNDPDSLQLVIPFTFADSNGVLVHAAIVNGVTNVCEGVVAELRAQTGATSYLWSNGDDSQVTEVSESGLYSVTVVDYNGCESEAEIDFTFHMPMAALGNDTTICAGDDLTIQAIEGMDSYLWSTEETTSAITVNAAGTYAVAIADMYGCENTDTIVVAVSELPTVNLGADQSITNLESTILDAGSHTSYLWSTGATTQSVTVDGATVGVGTHTYGVTVTNEFTCEGTDQVVVTVTDGTAIPEYLVGADLFSLYPNPTDGLFYLESEDAMNAEVSLLITDLTGRVLLMKQYDSFKGNETIDISNLDAGIYTIAIKAGDAEFKTNIILE